jgi:hypothetical protein
MNDAHALDDTVTKDAMRQLPLFAGLSEADLDTLYHMTSMLTVPKDYVLMQEGGPPDSAYVIVLTANSRSAPVRAAMNCC